MLGIAESAWPVRVGGVVALCVTCACGGDPASAAGKSGPGAASPAVPTPSEAELALEKEQARIAAEFPLHGLVTGTQLKVRVKPDPNALVLGWLRVGSDVLSSLAAYRARHDLISWDETMQRLLAAADRPPS